MYFGGVKGGVGPGWEWGRRERRKEGRERESAS